MSHAVLGPQFDEHIEAFRSKAAHTATPKGAQGVCERISESFVHHLYDRGAEGREREFSGLVGGHSESSHTVVEHQGHIVDWAARQYWPEAGHPLVEPVEQYKRRWREDYG